MARVTVLMGSGSDLEIVKPCLQVLEQLEIDFEVFISSAHRTPQRTDKLIASALQAGAQVFICAAGMAAHLAGTVAARTCKPVIGLPIAGSTLNGLDALFSTAQMPAGFPVATVALNGARNAAWLAAQILALQDSAVEKRIQAARQEMAMSIENASQKLEAQFN
ncbi:MAG: 5-(carboxyamino)imidazole ribonucleotide mutase [Desulfovibrio sp.]|nr:5-(carboxyamino)imidazole ribonucleotide mutase [Desulfovibrio sp.]